MATNKVQVIEVVEDKDLRKKERAATRAFRRFFSDAPPLKLYRTVDGRFGFQVQLALVSGQRERFERAYRAVMKVLGERRGRPAGPHRVQTKLRLKEPVYRALRTAARRSHTTVSDIVEDLAHKARLV